MVGALIAKQAIRSAFGALNNGDLEKFMRAWSENGVFVYPGKVKAGGQFTGKTQVKKWFEEFIRQFPQRKFIINHVGVNNIFDLVGNNTLFAQLDLEFTNKDGLKGTNRGITLITLKGAKVIRAEDFLKITDGDEYKRGWGDIK
jgi:ketosteroid isomerase-like protein